VGLLLTFNKKEVKMILDKRNREGGYIRHNNVVIGCYVAVDGCIKAIYDYDKDKEELIKLLYPGVKLSRPI